MAGPVLVVGVGGLGGTLVGHLARAGVDVTGLTTNADVVEAVGRHGLRLTGLDGAHEVQAPVLSALPEGARFETVILTTPPTAVEAAARAALPHLAPTGQMVVLQNGLCETRVAKIAGDDRVIGCVVMWGASMPEPGVFERTGLGGMTLGRIDGTVDEAVHARAALLAPAGPTDVTTNLAGKRWGKLALNCMVSTLGTIRGDRLGKVLFTTLGRNLGLELIGETIAVAVASGARPEKMNGVDLEWLSPTAAERAATVAPSLWLKHAVQLAVGVRYRRMRSSMLAGIERGREPPIDFLNGEVVRRGRELGIPTPVSEVATELVWAIHRREEVPGAALMKKLHQLAVARGAPL